MSGSAQGERPDRYKLRGCGWSYHVSWPLGVGAIGDVGFGCNSRSARLVRRVGCTKNECLSKR